MVTRRKHLEYWTETKRTIVPKDGSEPYVKVVVCCCKGPGMTRRECSDAAGNKTPCRCYCHKKDG